MRSSISKARGCREFTWLGGPLIRKIFRSGLLSIRPKLALAIKGKHEYKALSMRNT